MTTTTTTPRVPERLRIVVLGYLVRGPLGGLAWHHLQYVAGFARMGHDVLFVEDSDDYASCVHLDRDELDTDPTDGLKFAEDALAQLGVEGRTAYWDAHTSRWFGSAGERAEEFCRSADVVFNVSAINPVRPWWAEAPARVLIDTDPGFVQIRNLQSNGSRELAAAHNVFATFADSWGRPECTIPDDGLPWQPTRQPVVLDAWAISQPPRSAPLTTVMQWDSYKSLEHEGLRLGMKSESFDPYMNLPARAMMPLLLGIGGASRPPRKQLLDANWQIRNPIEFTRTPWEYRRFIQASAGEFSIAKHGYVVTQSGWFSERSANYLASGRPVILEDTGFSNHLPTDSGLLAFSTPDQAVDMINHVAEDLARHGREARGIAEDHFDSAKVLQQLLDCASSPADSTGVTP